MAYSTGAALMIEECGPDCLLCAADQAARQRRLDTHRKYNASSKGQARNRAYEARHPERKLRWEPARNALRSGLGPAPETPMHNGADLPPEPADVTVRQLAGEGVEKNGQEYAA